MPFLGKTPTVGNFILLDSITVSNTATFALTKDSLDYYPGSAQNMIVSVNGVTQAPLTAYTITDNNIIFSSALNSDSDVIDYILVLGDTLNIGRPSDSTVGATQLQDYAVTSVKMSNTGVGAATYGTSTSIPQITIDAAGRITSATGIDRSNQFEDLTVTGNLTVSGNTVTVDAQTLSVEDPLIHLASNNETSDVVDIGFVGHYSNDGGTTKLHTGFFRDASDEKYYLFNGFEDATLDLSNPATTIDRTANTFTLADLNVADLNAGGLSLEATNAELSFTDAGRLSKLYTRNGGRDLEILANQDVLINASGGTNVGIGTTSPSQRLDVREEKTGGGVLVQVYNADNSDTTTQTAGLALGPDTRGGTARIIAVKENADFSTNAGRDIALTFSSVLNNSATERMRIASSGNVAIGNTNATYILDVDVGAPSSSDQVLGRFSSQNGIRDIGFVWDDSASTLGIATLTNHALTFHTGGNSNERMRIDTSGNVGIGTTTPSSYNSIMDDLVIARSGDSGITLVSGTTSEGSIAFADGTSGADTYRGWINYNHNSNFLRFATNASVRMYIDSAGKIGVGNQNPSGSFHVTTKDASGADVFYIAQNTTSNRVAGYRVLDENGTASLQMQYDNGGNTASIINPNNGLLSIYLGGTTTSNELDDYEEGTWTPVVSSSSSVTVNSAIYTKIGRTVTFNCYISWSNNINNNTSRWNISGLPFHSSLTSNFQAVTIGYTGAVQSDDFLALKHATVAELYLHRSSGGNSQVWSNADIWNRGLNVIIISGTYQLAS